MLHRGRASRRRPAAQRRPIGAPQHDSRGRGSAAGRLAGHLPAGLRAERPRRGSASASRHWPCSSRARAHRGRGRCRASGSWCAIGNGAPSCDWSAASPTRTLESDGLDLVAVRRRAKGSLSPTVLFLPQDLRAGPGEAAASAARLPGWAYLAQQLANALAPGRDLRPAGDRLRADLRHHRADQPRLRRVHHGRRLRGAARHPDRGRRSRRGVRRPGAGRPAARGVDRCGPGRGPVRPDLRAACCGAARRPC